MNNMVFSEKAAFDVFTDMMAKTIKGYEKGHIVFLWKWRYNRHNVDI